MSTWIYIFSRFSSEALLIEALTISVLAIAYTGYWIIKKRRDGVIKADLPGPVARTYLNQLIFDAQDIRAQLFGLLSASGLAPAARVFTGAPIAAPSAGAGDSGLQGQIASLEARLTVQTQALEGITAEKTKLERELQEAKALGNVAAGDNGAQDLIAKLQEKIAQLETRLAEYSVIEDDLANLKRLQQENQALKDSLTKAGTPIPTVAAAAVAAPVAAAAPPPPAPAAASTIPLTAGDPAAAITAAESQLSAPVVEATTDAGFEGLIDQMEQSLEPTAAAPAEPSPLDSMAAPPASPPPDASGGKSDADLVAEFEKMLNG